MAYVKGDLDEYDGPGTPGSSKRDETLAVVEDFELGPKEFDTPADDPEWNKVEPYSAIRLSYVLAPFSYLEFALTGSR